MFVDYYCNICNSLRMVHLPFAAINGPLSLPAQRTKKVLEREELQRAQAIAVVSQVVFSYSQIMFWFSISECSTWIGNIQMESKHETTRQWMHRFVEVFWPSVVECPNFQPIRGQDSVHVIWLDQSEVRMEAYWPMTSGLRMTGMWQTNSDDDTGLHWSSVTGHCTAHTSSHLSLCHHHCLMSGAWPHHTHTWYSTGILYQDL